MPAKPGKQKRTMEAIKHGWKPRKGDLRKVSPADARRILGEDEAPKKKKKK